MPRMSSSLSTKPQVLLNKHSHTSFREDLQRRRESKRKSILPEVGRKSKPEKDKHRNIPNKPEVRKTDTSSKNPGAGGQTVYRRAQHILSHHAGKFPRGNEPHMTEMTSYSVIHIPKTAKATSVSL